MSDRQKSPDEQRRELFRRMERVFVVGPPVAIGCITLFGSLFLATFVPLRGTTFWERWALAVVAIFVVPLIAYLVRNWWENR